jgi:hypothetical protein
MKILITGGPVHANLDAVKIITNKFKGGLMCDLADRMLSKSGVGVTYLTAKGANLPVCCEIVYHDGFHDYHKKVCEMAPNYDVVILGAAVANLIPLSPWKGKFPSHNYKPGDVIPIEFTIAPRVIDDVKRFAPNTHLFGFKLLSGVPHDELITAAYGVLLESKATAVFANDAKDLLTKYAVTKERGVHKMGLDGMVDFIHKASSATYYRTVICEKHEGYDDTYVNQTFQTLADRFSSDFKPTPEGYVFGTIAIKNPDGSFLTTGRGKNELNDKVMVYNVNHLDHVVEVHSDRKASLNAPLLDWIFKTNPKVHAIVHLHIVDEGFSTKQYETPGTVADSKRDVKRSFNIENHGCFILFDNKLNPIV